MYENFSFKVGCYDGNARVGTIITPRGAVKTPAFIFCGTKAAIKSLDIARVVECNTQIILSNTYHLMLQPGSHVIKKLGGLHKVMGWSKPMFTDSGGYQIFSLGHGSVSEEIKGIRNNKNRTLLQIDETGATFRSYVDGSLKILTPEKSIEIQENLGADLIAVLDECTPFNVDYDYTRLSMERSHRWALRSLNEFKKRTNEYQALYGIVQGGVYNTLRSISCDFITELPFFAYAIGGSLGASKNQMYDIVSFSMERLKKDRPVHLLGIGRIDDIFEGVSLGVDTFDCVHPTRIARHGGALVKLVNRDQHTIEKDYINLRNSKFKIDDFPIEKDCMCFTCQNHSRGYLHHLLKTKELLSYTLITIHNVYFMNNLMEKIRAAIANSCLEKEKKNWVIP